MSAIGIVYGAVAGTVVGSLFGRPAYGLGRGLSYGAIVFIANAILGSVGFYGSLTICGLSLVAEASAFTQRQMQNNERIRQVANEQLWTAT